MHFSPPSDSFFFFFSLISSKPSFFGCRGGSGRHTHTVFFFLSLPYISAAFGGRLLALLLSLRRGRKFADALQQRNLICRILTPLSHFRIRESRPACVRICRISSPAEAAAEIEFAAAHLPQSTNPLLCERVCTVL